MDNTLIESGEVDNAPKSTKTFRATIEAYLKERASKEPLLARMLEKEGKNIKDCINYIFGCVQKSGCNGFTSEEVYNMAVHYYCEDDLEINEFDQYEVIVNHKVELTEEEIREAKESAIREIVNEQKSMLKKKVSVTPKVENQGEQASLF